MFRAKYFLRSKTIWAATLIAILEQDLNTALVCCLFILLRILTKEPIKLKK